MPKNEMSQHVDIQHVVTQKIGLARSLLYTRVPRLGTKRRKTALAPSQED